MTPVCDTADGLFYTYAIRTAVQRAIACEHTANQTPKVLHACVWSDPQPTQISMQVSGGMGLLKMKQKCNDAHSEVFGLPSDNYLLNLQILSPTDSLPLQPQPTLQCITHRGADFSFTGNLQVDRNVKAIQIRFNDNTILTLDTYALDDSENHHLFWLNDTCKPLAAVQEAYANLKRLDGFALQSGMDAMPASWSSLSVKLKELSSLMHELEPRVDSLSERNRVTADCPVFQLFGDTRNIDRDASHMCVAFKHQMSTADLTRIKALTDRVESHLLTVRNMTLSCKTIDCFRTPIINALLQSRASTIKNISSTCATRESSKANRMQTRVNYLLLTGIDANLRRHVGQLCHLDSMEADIDLQLCQYQLRQLYANNTNNAMQLSKTLYDQSMAQMRSDVYKVQAIVDTQPDSDPLLVKVRWAGYEPDADTWQTAEDFASHKDFEMFLTAYEQRHNSDSSKMIHANLHILTRSVLAQKILESWRVAPVSNYIYSRQRASMCTNTVHANNPEQAKAKSVVQKILHADVRHRIITPMLQQWLLKTLMLPTASADDISTAIGVFSTNLQPCVRLAMTGQATPDAFEFLHSSQIDTGYNDKSKTDLLIKLMMNQKGRSIQCVRTSMLPVKCNTVTAPEHCVDYI
tara:strand:+ start:696 stop:2603 length:1908 start_codon:yes stop_codon:yes gene_type:complete